MWYSAQTQMRMRESKSSLDVCQQVCSSSCGPVYLCNADYNQYIEIVCNYYMDAKIVHRRFVEKFSLWAGLIFVHTKIFRGFLLSIRTRKVRVVTLNELVPRGINTLGPTGAHWLTRMEGGRKSIEDNSETEQTISSLPDFAQIFAFLQLFGNALHLLPVTLKDLEDFFAYGILQNTSNINVILGILIKSWGFLNGAHQNSFCVDPVPMWCIHRFN